jgi:hypothetical protein
MRDNIGSQSKGFSRIRIDWLRDRIFLLLLIPCLALGFFGYRLAKSAFPDSGVSSRQISVAVYVSRSPAHVILKSYAYLDPQYDKIDVNVTGPKGVKDPWILVVQCPADIGLPHAHMLYSEGTSGEQKLGNVIVSNHNNRNYSGPLRCFKKAKTKPGIIKGQNIAATLPVLEQNASAQSAPTETPLYVERSVSGHQNIVDLVEVLQPPDSSCPGQETTSGTAVAGGSLESGRSDPTPSPINGTCYHQVTPGTIATKYYLPAQAVTFETLENVDLTNETVQSMFPPGQITSNDKIRWQGLFSLSPSLSATSLTSGRNASINSFLAGVLLGLFGGFLVPIIQGFLPAPKPKGGRTDKPLIRSAAETTEMDGHP